jgi:hypothetical protein
MSEGVDTREKMAEVYAKRDEIRANIDANGDLSKSPPSGFIVRDSGARQQFASGMVRDVETDKPDYTLVVDGPMMERWAAHLTKGAQKYAARNWMQANGEEEYERFRRSAFRHFLQWMAGEDDEDHAAAVFFNINGAEYAKERL